MINEDNAGGLLRGLVILAHSLPQGVCDANGDNLVDCFEQTIHDLADELGLSHKVDFNAAGEPRDAVMVDRITLFKVHSAGDELGLMLADLPLWGHINDD